MRDTTLNLIAISIFSLTMLALLGPMLELSPVVPALLVVGLLGVTTLDQAGLDGRIGNIVVDWLSWTSPEHRQRVLHHEAGHFLVAILLDVPVIGYSLTTWDAWRQGLPGQGGVVFDTQSLETHWQTGQISTQMVDAYCKVWMAGIAAEQMVYGQAIGGQDDRRKFQQLWQQLDRPIAESQIRQRWSSLQAKTLLEKHQAAFDALAQAMATSQSVDQCRQIVLAHVNQAAVD